MDPQQIDLVKEWVRLDNIVLHNNLDVQTAKDEVKRLEERVSETIEQRKGVEKKIIEYVKTNKLESMQLKISDGVITFGRKTVQKPISHKYIRDILEKYADENPDEEINPAKLYEFITSNIEKKVDYNISRNIKNPGGTAADT